MKACKLIAITAASLMASLFWLSTASAADLAKVETTATTPISTAVTVNTEAVPSDNKFVTADVIASQGKQTSCTVPPPKKRLQPLPVNKPEPAEKAVSPIITNVCAPVINLHLPLGTSEKGVQQTHEGETLVATTRIKSQAEDAAPLLPSQPPDNFKFKVKDLVEADLSTHSSTLMWALVGIFVGFAIIVVLGLRAASKHSFKPAASSSIVVICIVLAAFIAYLVIHSLAPRSIEDTTINRVYNEWASTQILPVTASAPDWTSAEQQLTAAQVELARMQNQLSAQLNHVADMSQNSNDSHIAWQIFALLLLGIGACYVFMTRRAQTPTHLPPAQEQDFLPLPLNDLYRLEDILSNVTAVTNSYGLTGFNRPEIDPNEFLHEINRVRQLLESGLESMEPSEPSSVIFNLPEDSTRYFPLNISIEQLDKILMSRYETPREEWRKKALKQLAATRREILSRCKVQQTDMDSSIN